MIFSAYNVISLYKYVACARQNLGAILLGLHIFKRLFVMRKIFPTLLVLVFGVFSYGVSYAAETNADKEKIYLGFYSREGNDAKMAQATGNNTYIKFFPDNRIVRLYIPYPYSKTVKPEAINKAFNSALKKSDSSAYIRDKFGVMEQVVVAHLDIFRWIEGQVMFDCSKPNPCKVIFEKDSMTVIKPGIVVEHKIQYALIKD